MRIVKGLLIGIALFIGLLFMGLLYSIALGVMHAMTDGPSMTSHATGLSAILGGLLEVTVFNAFFYLVLASCLLVGYKLAKPRKTANPTP